MSWYYNQDCTGHAPPTNTPLALARLIILENLPPSSRYSGYSLSLRGLPSIQANGKFLLTASGGKMVVISWFSKQQLMTRSAYI